MRAPSPPGETHVDHRTQRRRLSVYARGAYLAPPAPVPPPPAAHSDTSAQPHARCMTGVGKGTAMSTSEDLRWDPFGAAGRGGTRNKMLVSAAQVMRERGAAGVTIDAGLARSGAPRGSVYYHFPEGRSQILIEALRYAGESITATIDEAVGRGGKALLREFIEFWERLLAKGEFNAGCPVVAAAIGSADDDLQLAAEAGIIVCRLCDALTRASVAEGFDDEAASSLAMT